MSICIIPDCNGKRHGNGYCGKHYARILANGTLKTKTERHGLRHVPEYLVWADMKSRCYNKKRECYPRYGGRGITVCDEWRQSFLAFYEYVGKRPDESYSIDRIDNNGDYAPCNVRWATKTEQSFNRRLFKNNTSGHKGISAYGKKWMIYSNASGKRKTIGYSESLEGAIKIKKAYDASF